MKQLRTEYDVAGRRPAQRPIVQAVLVGQIDVKQRLAEELGIKALVLEADHGDQRRTRRAGAMRLQAFMESFGE